MNLSAWDSIPFNKRRSPSLSNSHLIIEFERTKRSKIFSHKLGSVNFSRSRDINAERQEVIDREITNISENTGFRYRSIGHVYSADQLISAEDSGWYKIYAHGGPIKGGRENCQIVGMSCDDGQEGSDTSCLAGKCIIGRIKKIREKKWKYESLNVYSNLPVSYFVSGDESVTLKPIIRGFFTTYGEDGMSPVTVNINKPASLPVKIFLPPRDFFSEDFLLSLVSISDSRLSGLVNKPQNDKIGIETRKDRFVRGVLLKSYPNSTEGVISNRFSQSPTEEVKSTLLEIFSNAPSPWLEYCNTYIEEEFTSQPTTLEYICSVYDLIYNLFGKIIQVTKSNLSSPKILYDKEQISRPVYSRLPGVSESYRSDPAFSEDEKPAQWLTSGADDFLSKKKESIETFYYNYLNPETCSSFVLDWLAQHVGLTGFLWNTEWDRGIKEAMIRNAFGWWNRESIDDFGKKTPKGMALNKFPFTNPEWTDQTSEDNLMEIRLDEIETIYVDTDGEYTSYDKFKSLDESFSQLVNVSNLSINKLLWNGLIESKGSLLCIMFLVSLFGLKSHSPEELEIIDADKKILKPKSGLRNAEFSAPPLLPTKYSVLQVGTEDDAEIGNYTNQLIAGVSRFSSVEESRNVFFRVPYYYNRDGKSWDRTKYIAENWMASNLNVRVQYPYLSADLWAVGDAFFEPELKQQQ